MPVRAWRFKSSHPHSAGRAPTGGAGRRLNRRDPRAPLPRRSRGRSAAGGVRGRGHRRATGATAARDAHRGGRPARRAAARARPRGRERRTSNRRPAATLHGGAPRVDPGGDRPLALPAGSQRTGGRRPAPRPSRPVAPPRREAGLRRRLLPDARRPRRRHDPRARPARLDTRERRRRDQDRDHRRRGRSEARLLRPVRIHDAGGLPQRAGGVHDGQGDRRAGLPSGRRQLEVRGPCRSIRRTPATRPTSRGSLPETPTRTRTGCGSAGSHRRPTSATTRRSPSPPGRGSASTGTRRRSWRRSRPRSQTAWT